MALRPHSRRFKCLHMQAGAIGPTMTCGMQLAGMAQSRSLSPVVPSPVRNWVVEDRCLGQRG